MSIKLVVISNKPYKTDFRKYLMRAAEAAGITAVHIYSWNNIVLTHQDRTIGVFENITPFPLILEQLSTVIDPNDKLVVLTGLGCHRTAFAWHARSYLHNAMYIYDVFDDLSFGSRRRARIKRAIIDMLWRLYCDVAMVLEKGWGSRYPGSFHLDNASHMQPVERVPETPSRKMVYIGSMDKRVDFDVLDRLAAEDNVTIDIYGTLQPHNLEVRDGMSTLLKKRTNVIFQGSYDNDELANILPHYAIGILPYKINDRLTEHVNPDKLYHYLNAGLEVIATPIPQAVRLGKYIHLIDEHRALSDVLHAAEHAPRAQNWPAADYNWDKRWEQLSNFVTNNWVTSRPLVYRPISIPPLKPFAKGTPEYPLLQLGCGSNILPGWVNTDFYPMKGAHFLDFSRTFPFHDASFDAVFSEHTIEHVPKSVALNMCREVFRVLKPGGVFRVVTPSLENMADLILHPESDRSVYYLEWFRTFINTPDATLADAVNAMFYNHGHQHIFAEAELAQLLTEAGFINVHIVVACKYHFEIFHGVDAHGKVIGEAINDIEAFALEVEKPANQE